MRHDPPHELLALRVGDDPVEKIALDRAVDSRGGEGLAGQQPFGIVLPHPHDRERDTFGDDDQKGVLKPKRVALDVAAIDEL